jgi:hypothetical protein
MPRGRPAFDPRAILAALERNYLDYVVIGGLARVIRGTDETTAGVDICPSFAAANLQRLAQAAAELGATPASGGELDLSEESLGSTEVTTLMSPSGELKVIPSPAGAPTGFVDLRRASIKEHLGHGLQPLVASTADLARLTAALHRDQDIDWLRQLRRILELEGDRSLALTTTTLAPPRRSAQTQPGPKLTR